MYVDNEQPYFADEDDELAGLFTIRRGISQTGPRAPWYRRPASFVRPVQPAPVTSIQPAPPVASTLPRLFVPRPATPSPRVPWYRYRAGPFTMGEVDYDDEGLDGFFSRINPVNIVRQQVRTVRAVTSGVARAARQAASTAVMVAKKTREAQMRLARQKADTMRRLAMQKAQHAMQIMSKVKGGGGAAPEPVEQIVEQPAPEPVMDDTSWLDNQYSYAQPAMPPAAPESYNEETPPEFSEDIVYGGEPIQSFYEGEENMEMSNVPSDVMLPAPSNLRDTGMGSIWSDLMTTGMEVSKHRATASIAQSQAAQADALARAEAARAAAVAAAQKPGLPVPLMLGAAAGLGLLLVVMRKRRA